jgi:putative ABC transport system permease protein
VTHDQLLHLAIGVVALLALTYAALRIGDVRLGRGPLFAIARGSIQLAAVGLALHGALTRPWAVGLAVAVMMTTATWTAGSRIRALAGARGATVTACVTGAGLALGTVFVLRVLPFQSRYVVALSGIVIGNTMTGATLAGRHLISGLRARRDEVEAWLSIGATMRQAVRDIARTAAGEALIPAMDQTRTTGLVTLPGAFIGALLAGANPTQAARFQLVVLAAIMAAQAVVAVLLVYLLGAPSRLPID